MRDPDRSRRDEMIDAGVSWGDDDWGDAGDGMPTALLAAMIGACVLSVAWLGWAILEAMR